MRHVAAFRLVGLLGLPLAGCFLHHQEPATDRATLDTRFQAKLEAFRGEHGFPGATAAYILPDRTVRVFATGLADVEAGTPMTPESRMLAASIGKSFVGATAVALSAEGRLDLDEPISKWLGDRSWFSRLPNHDTITLRHLLTHSAGLPDHVYMEEFAHAVAKHWRDPGSPFPPEKLVEFILDEPPLFEPGEGWAYTDTGYILIGLIIETVSEDSFYEEVARRFLEPLGLERTSPSDRRELPLLAAGYTAPDNPLGLPPKTTVSAGVMAWNPAVEWTGGGFISHPGDLVMWAKALYEGRAMEGDYLKELFHTAPVTGFFSSLLVGKIRYGAGVGIYERGPLGPRYGHGGGIPGYTSSMRYYPDHRIAVAFQINTDVETDEFAGDMEESLARIVIE